MSYDLFLRNCGLHYIIINKLHFIKNFPKYIHRYILISVWNSNTVRYLAEINIVYRKNKTINNLSNYYSFLIRFTYEETLHDARNLQLRRSITFNLIKFVRYDNKLYKRCARMYAKVLRWLRLFGNSREIKEHQRRTYSKTSYRIGNVNKRMNMVIMLLGVNLICIFRSA